MLYDRKIKYVDMYENGERVQNAGFLRLERKDEQMGMQLQIIGLKRLDTCVCPIILIGEKKEEILDNISIEKGKGSYVNKNIHIDGDEKWNYEMLREVKMTLPGGTILRCIINDQEVQEERIEDEEDVCETNVVFKSEAELLREAFVAERRMLEGDVAERRMLEDDVAERRMLEGDVAGHKMRASDVATQESAAEAKIQEEKEKYPSIQTENRKGRPMNTEDKWQQLWEIYPHIKPFEDSREYMLVKPEDFVVLQDKYYHMSANSFLLHGYYNYNHLIMGKEEKENQRKIYIGVPGNFYDKEKQVARLFGFESFEGKYEPAGTGDFGYYMVRVEI